MVLLPFRGAVASGSCSSRCLEAFFRDRAGIERSGSNVLLPVRAVRGSIPLNGVASRAVLPFGSYSVRASFRLCSGFDQFGLGRDFIERRVTVTFDPGMSDEPFKEPMIGGAEACVSRPCVFVRGSVPIRT